MDDQGSPDNGAQDKPELALDFDFLPTWAREPPKNPYGTREDHDDRDRPRDRFGRRDDHRGGGGRGPDRGRSGARPGPGRSAGGFRPGGSRPGGSRPDGRSPAGHSPGEPRTGAGPRPPRDGDRRGPRRDGERRPPREFHPRLDVKVSFLPDRERLALVVRDIQASRRAFPLVEIASRFLSREDLYLVKLELPPPAEGAERQTFLQCLECKRVFRARANAEAHILGAHLDKYFAIEETEVEPPAGIFACVARCGLSHTLLGPPNHHGYNEKIQELWVSRFAHMSKADYLGHIETVRDEALVEQWKESVRKKIVYRLKEPPEGQEAAPMTRAEAQEWMRGRLNPLLRESPRCMLPGSQSRKMDDDALRAAVSAAWQKECRFPLSLLLALRPAFRHMHLHVFKVNAKETFVTAVAPAPVDPAAAPVIVKEILAFLEANPGIPRQQVLDGLRAGADPESSAASEVLLHLGNLVSNGGVIEFFNGTLTLPRAGAPAPAGPSKNKPPAPKAPAGDAHPPEAGAAEASAGEPAEEHPEEAAPVPAAAEAGTEELSASPPPAGEADAMEAAQPGVAAGAAPDEEAEGEPKMETAEAGTVPEDPVPAVSTVDGSPGDELASQPGKAE